MASSSRSPSGSSSARLGWQPTKLADGSPRLKICTRFDGDDFDNASCAAALPDGSLCVADTGNHRLLVMSPQGRILNSFGEGGHGLDDFRGPRGLAATEHYLFVADCYNCRVKKLRLTDGAVEATCGGYGERDGHLRYPHGLALTPDGQTLYVADSGSARIVAYRASDLSYLFDFALDRRATPVRGRTSPAAQAPPPAASQPGPGQSRPFGLAVLGGEIFVCDAFNRRLQVFSLGGAFERFLAPRHVEGYPLLNFPEGIAAAGKRLFVSDKQGESVHVLAPSDGASLQVLPFLVHTPHALVGVATDGMRVFVVDEVRNEVQVLVHDDASPRRGHDDAAAGESRRPLLTPEPTPPTAIAATATAAASAVTPPEKQRPLSESAGGTPSPTPRRGECAPSPPAEAAGAAGDGDGLPQRGVGAGLRWWASARSRQAVEVLL